MFRGQNQRVRFEASHGMEITAHGRISVYPPQGRYQLIVDQMLPAGQGDLHLAFETLKKKLHSEGLFDPSLKKSLPRYPECVGIVTSPTGAAIQDMMNIISRRFPLTKILVFPVKVQGEGAAHEIARAVKVLNSLQDCQVLLVGRGGGSLEDLWAFNEEIVARAISESQIPVISAVGHETDTTISDYVADLRAPTPSAAAEMVVPDKLELLQRLNHLGESLKSNLFHRVDRQSQHLGAIEKSYAFRRPQIMIEQFLQNLDTSQDIIARLTLEKFRTLNTRLDHLYLQCEGLNPLNILEKGYSVVSDEDGKIIRTVEQVSVGDTVNIRLRDGEITTSAQTTKKEK